MMMIDATPPWFYVVVFHGLDQMEVRLFPTHAACQRSQRATEEAMRAIWGISQCGRRTE